jgi:hypothetical protein
MRTRNLVLVVVAIAGALLIAGYGVYQEYVLQGVLIKNVEAVGNRLSAYGQQLEQSADVTGQRIGFSVYQNRSMVRDMEVLRQAEQIIIRADSVADSLGALSLFIALTDARLAGPHLLYSAGGLPAAIDAPRLQRLVRQLERYMTFIRLYVPDAPALTNRQKWQTANFSNYYFLNSTEPVALATLARLITEVRRQELAALSVQAQKVGSHCICFDKIGAVAVPVSGTVAAGAPYEAQLMLAESFSEFYYKHMTVNGHPVRRFENEQGLVEIPIPPSALSATDTLHAKWHGIISASLYPADTTWRLTVPFLVVQKPTL